MSASDIVNHERRAREKAALVLAFSHLDTDSLDTVLRLVAAEGPSVVKSALGAIDREERSLSFALTSAAVASAIGGRGDAWIVQNWPALIAVGVAGLTSDGEDAASLAPDLKRLGVKVGMQPKIVDELLGTRASTAEVVAAIIGRAVSDPTSILGAGLIARVMSKMRVVAGTRIGGALTVAAGALELFGIAALAGQSITQVQGGTPLSLPPNVSAE